jgi:hypothetical protein
LGITTYEGNDIYESNIETKFKNPNIVFEYKEKCQHLLEISEENYKKDSEDTFNPDEIEDEFKYLFPQSCYKTLRYKHQTKDYKEFIEKLSEQFPVQPYPQ